MSRQVVADSQPNQQNQESSVQVDIDPEKPTDAPGPLHLSSLPRENRTGLPCNQPARPFSVGLRSAYTLSFWQDTSRVLNALRRKGPATGRIRRQSAEVLRSR